MENINNQVYCIQAITNDGNILLLTSNDFEIDFIHANSISFINDIQVFNTFEEAKYYIAENGLAKWCSERYNGVNFILNDKDQVEGFDCIKTLNILPILIGIKYSESIKITDI